MNQQMKTLQTVRPGTRMSFPDRPGDEAAPEAREEVVWSFFEGDPSDLVVIAPASEIIESDRAELTWDFSGFDRTALSLQLGAGTQRFTHSAALDPAVRGATARVAVSADRRAVGPVELSFT